MRQVRVQLQQLYVTATREGRRVLDLTQDDFVRILAEPKSALTKQYAALMQTEGVELAFTDDGVEALAELADILVTDQALREQIIARQRQRVQDFLEESVKGQLRQILKELSFLPPNAFPT